MRSLALQDFLDCAHHGIIRLHGVDFVEGHPLGIQGIGACLKVSCGCLKQNSNIVMQMGWVGFSSRYFMNVDVKKTRPHGGDSGQPRLLFHFSFCSQQNVRVVGLNVATRLQPATEFSVEDQKQIVLVRGEDKCARCEVAWDKMVSRETGRASIQQLKHVVAKLGFLGVAWTVVIQEGEQVVYTFHEQGFKPLAQGVRVPGYDSLVRRPLPKQRILAASAALLVFVVAFGVRLQSLAVGGMLADSVGPWLVAWGDPYSGHAHAPLYGWGLLVPYRLSLFGAQSLWEAVAALQVFHALVAPLVFLLVLRLRRGALAVAFLAAMVVALDGGLLDTARSGSEGYFAPFWIGVLLFGRLHRDTPWGPALAWGGAAMAVMNHPLAVCAAPFLVGLPLRTRAGQVGLALGLLVLLPVLSGGRWNEAGGSGGLEVGGVVALDAWLKEGGLAAWALLLAPFVALLRRESRWLAMACLLALSLLFLLGNHLGYLRDHHIRLLTVPMAVCFAGIPGRWSLLLLLCLKLPDSKLPPEGSPPRPGTLGMTTGLALDLLRTDLAERFYVDGAWVSGALVAEPSAVMLDLHLRGVDLQRIHPGGEVVVLVSSQREGLGPAPEKGLLSRGDHHWLLSNPEPSALICHEDTRRGGAWDFLSLAHPDLEGGQIGGWARSCGKD